MHRRAGETGDLTLRVGHLIKGLGRGGAEMLLPHLATAMQGRVASSIGYFLPWKSELRADLEARGANVTCFGARSSIAMLSRIGAVAAWSRERRLDVIHCHLPLAGVVGRLAARRVGVPLVYTEHNLQERYRTATRWLNARTWRLQQHVVAVSGEVARSIAGSLPRAVPVTVVPNGIPEFEVTRDSRQARTELGLPDGPIVGTVAVFRKQKRLDHWLQAARVISDRAPNATFVMVGDGPLRQRMEADARRLGLGERVFFPGLRTDVISWLASMDVFLISSEFEGLPLAMLEAMMARRPVVATAVGGIPEVVEDDRTGYVVPFGDVNALAERVIRLLADRDLRGRIGDAAREQVIREHGIEAVADRLIGIYERVLAQRSS